MTLIFINFCIYAEIKNEKDTYSEKLHFYEGTYRKKRHFYEGTFKKNNRLKYFTCYLVKRNSVNHMVFF